MTDATPGQTPMATVHVMRRTSLTVAGLLVVMGVLGVKPSSSNDIFANWLSGADGFERGMDHRRGTTDAMLLYFYTDWCPHCRRFNQDIAASPDMQEYVRHAIAVRINPETGTREQALAKRYGVTGYPTLLVLPPGTEHTEKMSAYRASPAEFVAACEAAGSKRPVKNASSAPQPVSPVRRRPTAPAAPSAQKPPISQGKPLVRLKNGNVMEGTVEREDTQEVVLAVEGLGSVTLRRDEIVAIEEKEK